MIKAPITKTGEFRYVEIIKIAILVLFLFAFISVLVDRIVLSASTTLYIVNSLNIFVGCSLMLALIPEVKELFELIKSFIIEFIVIPAFEFGNEIVLCVDKAIQYFRNDVYKKLRVIRC